MPAKKQVHVWMAPELLEQVDAWAAANGGVSRSNAISQLVSSNRRLREDGERPPLAANLIFDGPPGAPETRFLRTEADDGESSPVGRWTDRDDGTWALRITADDLD